MRLYIFNILFLLSSFLCFSQKEERMIASYERHVDKMESHWNALIPQYLKVQYAGSMGVVSVGTGWAYYKDKLETDVMLGYLPKFDDKQYKLTLTFKQNYMPWNLSTPYERLSVQPLACGMYVNSIMDDRFWKKEPDRYPSDYYKFSTRIRFHIFLGQRLIIDLTGKSKRHKSVTLFYELSTCDLYFISAVTNKYLKPVDYLSLSFGAKWQII